MPIFLLFILVAFCCLSMETGYSLVLPVTIAKNTPLGIKAKPGDQLTVFSKFDFTKDSWKAYIVLAHDDFDDLNPNIKRKSCLKTTDRNLLISMQKSWKFKITAGDAGTVSSDFYLFRNGELVYKTGIILSNHCQRLQNEEYGEMIPVDSTAILKTCKKFKSVYWPVVIL